MPDNKGIGIASLAAGAVLTYGGIKGYSILKAAQNLIQGKNVNAGQSASLLTGGSSPGTGPNSPGSTGPVPAKDLTGSASANRALGRIMAAAMGWGTGQNWKALDNGWGTLESGWRTNAANNPSDPFNNAYGIPQANPGTKMASAGANWKTSAATQIKWGLGYIKSIYGSPSQVPGWLGGPYSGY